MIITVKEHLITTEKAAEAEAEAVSLQEVYLDLVLERHLT